MHEYKDDYFYVTSFQDRFYLYRVDQDLGYEPCAYAELVGGKKSLDKYYKGDFKVWIRKVLDKKMKTASRNMDRAHGELSNWMDVKEEATNLEIKYREY